MNLRFDMAARHFEKCSKKGEGSDDEEFTRYHRFNRFLMCVYSSLFVLSSG